MQLEMKNEKCMIQAFSMLVVKASWQVNRDFDIAVAYKTKDGTSGVGLSDEVI